MTIQRMRELLGKELDNLSDEELLQFDRQAEQFINNLLPFIMSQQNQEKYLLTGDRKDGNNGKEKK